VLEVRREDAGPQLRLLFEPPRLGPLPPALDRELVLALADLLISAARPSGQAPKTEAREEETAGDEPQDHA
jgi:hypothetical protein